MTVRVTAWHHAIDQDSHINCCFKLCADFYVREGDQKTYLIYFELKSGWVGVKSPKLKLFGHLFHVYMAYLTIPTILNFHEKCQQI